jgi:hypothetical protein
MNLAIVNLEFPDCIVGVQLNAFALTGAAARRCCLQDETAGGGRFKGQIELRGATCR